MKFTEKTAKQEKDELAKKLRKLLQRSSASKLSMEDMATQLEALANESRNSSERTKCIENIQMVSDDIAKTVTKLWSADKNESGEIVKKIMTYVSIMNGFLESFGDK